MPILSHVWPRAPTSVVPAQPCTTSRRWIRKWVVRWWKIQAGSCLRGTNIKRRVKAGNSLAAINYLAVKAEGHYAIRARDRVSHKSSLRLNVPRVITSVTRSSVVIRFDDKNDLHWSRPFLRYTLCAPHRDYQYDDAEDNNNKGGRNLKRE